MSIGEDGRVEIGKGVHVREFDGETVLLDLERGEYFGLDEIGALMWRALAGGESPREVASRLVADFDVEPARLLSDVVSLADQLIARRLAVPKP